MRQIRWITAADYLKQEAVSTTKPIYCAGLVTGTADGSVEHATVTGNLLAMVHSEMRWRGCRV
ncbi:MAG: hypothetical protein JNM66_15595 [Bryobacterales bacterium]|nr:hypothetical protein [Bryobacterales bacterium]